MVCNATDPPPLSLLLFIHWCLSLVTNVTERLIINYLCSIVVLVVGVCSMEAGVCMYFLEHEGWGKEGVCVVCTCIYMYICLTFNMLIA
jgi:hypothetical protein